MFIEFKTPAENPQFLAGHILKMVESEIASWATLNEIPYTCKYYKNTFRVAFNDDRHYTVFRLTWTDLPYTEHKIINRTW